MTKVSSIVLFALFWSSAHAKSGSVAFDEHETDIIRTITCVNQGDFNIANLATKYKENSFSNPMEKVGALLFLMSKALETEQEVQFRKYLDEAISLCLINLMNSTDEELGEICALTDKINRNRAGFKIIVRSQFEFITNSDYKTQIKAKEDVSDINQGRKITVARDLFMYAKLLQAKVGSTTKSEALLRKERERRLKSVDEVDRETSEALSELYSNCAQRKPLSKPKTYPAKESGGSV